MSPLFTREIRTGDPLITSEIGTGAPNQGVPKSMLHRFILTFAPLDFSGVVTRRSERDGIPFLTVIILVTTVFQMVKKRQRKLDFVPRWRAGEALRVRNYTNLVLSTLYNYA